jgi:AraC-like DNA-binding protein
MLGIMDSGIARVLNETRIHIEQDSAVRLTERMHSAPHAQHAVTVLLRVDAEVHVVAADTAASGRVLVVPADVHHSARCEGLAMSVLFDPERTEMRALGERTRRVDGKLAQRLVGVAREADGALLGLADEVRRTFRAGSAPRRDARVDAVLERLLADDTTDLHTLARSAGVSAPHLRALFERDVGISLRHYRLWRRLVSAIDRAVTSPPETTTRTAAEAGFADAAHLARTSRDLIGYPMTALLGRPRRR